MARNTAAETFVLRPRQLGFPDDAIAQRVHYVRPERPLAGMMPGALGLVGEQYRPPPVVIDRATEAMTPHRLNPDGADDFATFYALMPAASTVRPGRRPDRHVVKSKDERGRYALGSQHKMASVNGAAHWFDPEWGAPLSAGRHGKVAVTETKDRPRTVRAAAAGGKRVGTMHLRPIPDRGPDAVEVTIEPPSYAEDRTGSRI
jgi:hypothetical protein